jgi:hypothetical protein
LEVNRPSFLTRQQLWKSKLPAHLLKNDFLIDQLSEFDLTGANIQNVVLKADLISSFAEESFLSELLLELANEEAYSDGKMRKSQEIGFQRFAS